MMPTVFTRAQCRGSVSLNPDRPERPRPLAGARFELVQVGAHHALDELLEGQLGLPAESLAGPSGIADARRALGGAYTGLVHAQVALGVEIEAGEGGVGELGDGVRDAAGEYVVAGMLLLEHQPGAAHDVTGEGPVAHGVERAEFELVLAPERDRGGGARDAPRDETLGPALGLVVVGDRGARVQAVVLAQAAEQLVGGELGHGVWRARPAGRVLVLRALAG